MTSSVAAVDADAGLMGVAVQSHWLAVGAIVPWAAAGTGVLATQANSDLTAGRRGLELLASSRSAEATLAGLLRDDPRAAGRGARSRQRGTEVLARRRPRVGRPAGGGTADAGAPAVGRPGMARHARPPSRGRPAPR